MFSCVWKRHINIKVIVGIILYHNFSDSCCMMMRNCMSVCRDSSTHRMKQPIPNYELKQLGLVFVRPAYYLPMKRRRNYRKASSALSTGKFLSEALIFASTKTQYDDRLFIELQVQYMKIRSSNMGRTCCV